MPEILTKYPDVALTLLKDAGIKCGTGAPQQILTHCPKEHFCASPTGEFCVYGLNEVSAMTQISSADFSEAITGTPTMLGATNITLMVIIFAMGLLVGLFAASSRKRNK